MWFRVTLEEKLGTIKQIDYVQFCAGPRPDWEKRRLVMGDPGARLRVKVRMTDHSGLLPLT